MACACHSHGVGVFDVAGEDGINAVADCAMDGVVGALLFCRWCKDEHIKVEEEPPKWGGIDGVGVSCGDGVDSVGLESEEVGFVALLEVSPPGRTEVRGVVVCGGKDERDPAVP